MHMVYRIYCNTMLTIVFRCNILKQNLIIPPRLTSSVLPGPVSGHVFLLAI